MSVYLRIISIGLFFFYQYGLNNLLLPLSGDIRALFSLSSGQLGWLASLYFWGDIFFLLPAGWLIDHWGARRVVLVVMASSICLVVLSAIWPNLYVFAATRFLEGVCGGFGLLGSLKLGTFYLSRARFALMSGIISTLGMLGSFTMSMPLSLLLGFFNWQFALYIVGGVGLFILVLLMCATHKKPTQDIHKEHPIPFKKIVEVLTHGQTILNGLYVCFLTLPFFLLAALWGGPMLVTMMHISPSTSAFIISMLFVGNMLGAPFIGFLSDHFKRRKIFMYLGASLSFLILLLLILVGLKYTFLAAVLFLLLGIATSTQILAFTIVIEQNPHCLSGGVSSALAIISALGGAIGQPIFGLALSGLEHQGFSIADAYLKLCYPFLGAFMIAFFITYKIKSK